MKFGQIKCFAKKKKKKFRQMKFANETSPNGVCQMKFGQIKCFAKKKDDAKHYKRKDPKKIL